MLIVYLICQCAGGDVTASRPKVLITGASGLIGGLVIRDLSDKYEFSGLSRRSVPGIPHTSPPTSPTPVAIRKAMAGMDMVLHLAAETQDYDDWDKVMDITIGGTLNMYRAAQEAGVKRVVFMSTGSTMCGYEWYEGSPYGALAANEYDRLPEGAKMLTYLDPPRPDSFYGVGKLFGENTGRLFSDKYGMSVIVHPARRSARERQAGNGPTLSRLSGAGRRRTDGRQVPRRPRQHPLRYLRCDIGELAPLARYEPCQGTARLEADRLRGQLRSEGPRRLATGQHRCTDTRRSGTNCSGRTSFVSILPPQPAPCAAWLAACGITLHSLLDTPHQ